MTKERSVLQVELFDGYLLCCDMVPMGRDFALAVYGGDTPHVGSVVMTTVRPSLTGTGNGVTSSVLNGVGHKDGEIARMFAEAVALKAECVVTCSCGIHVDDITASQIAIVKEKSKLLLDRVLEQIDHR